MHGFVNETNNFANYPSIRGGNQGGGVIMTTKIKEINISLRSEIDYFLTNGDIILTFLTG